MEKIAIALDQFGHDTCGNPIARHTVFAYSKLDQDLDLPSDELYQTRVRQQVGSSNLRSNWANSALAKAKVTGVKLVDTVGDRAAGTMWLVYHKE